MEKIKTFRERLKESIEEKEYSQYTLAEKSGVPRTSISGYLTEVNKPNAEAVLKLAVALGVEPLWLLGYDVPKTKNNGVRNEIDQILNSMSEEEINKTYKIMEILMEGNKQ